MGIRVLEKTQREILGLVAGTYPQVYLVGGTAISLLYRHRVSEDLDFFTQGYSKALHRRIAASIGRATGFTLHLVDEEVRRRYVRMAVYDFRVTKTLRVKVDIVSDYADVLQPRQQNGIASIEDIYYRKVLAVVGWTSGVSATGRRLAGGRQTTKDLYDIFFLSSRIQRLSAWFPQHFDLEGYQRLAAWYLGVPRSKAVMELLELVPGCDTRRIFEHLDDEIISALNRAYVGL